MSDIKQLIENNQTWIKSKLSINKNYFNELSQGQNPKYLYIGCADSRIPIEQILGLDAGTIFVTRNIANQIPTNDPNSQSILDYAIGFLKVNHIIICGHYQCGGIKAALSQEKLGVQMLDTWINNIKDTKYNNQEILDSIHNNEQKYQKLVELNVHQQVKNLKQNKEFQKRKNELQVHSWVFDFSTGKILELSFQ